MDFPQHVCEMLPQKDPCATAPEKPPDGLRPAENFLEERRHRFPRPLVRQPVVGYPRHAHAVGVRIGETVHRAAIAHDLPVRLRFGQFLGEGVDLRHRDKRIIGAGADQDLRLDLPGHGWPWRLQPAVKGDHAPQGAPSRASSRAKVPPRQ
jgi:hypothetical protein